MNRLFWVLLIAVSCFGIESKPRYFDVWDSTQYSRGITHRWTIDTSLYETANGNFLSLVNPTAFAWTDSGVRKGVSGRMQIRNSFYAKGKWAFAFRSKCDSLFNFKYDLIVGGTPGTTTDYLGFYYHDTEGSIFRVRSHGNVTVDLPIEDESVFGEKRTWLLQSKTTDSLLLYMDDSLMGVFSSNPVYVDSLLFYYLGYGINAVPSGNFTGEIDWMMYFNDSLSDTEVDSFFANPWRDYTTPDSVTSLLFLGQSNMVSQAAGATATPAGYLKWWDSTLYTLKDPTNEVDSTGDNSMLPSWSSTMRDSFPTRSYILYNGALSSTGVIAGGSGQKWSDTTDAIVQSAFAVRDSLDAIDKTPTGIVFWAGESDVESDTAVLRDSLDAMVSKFRARFGNAQLPFYFVLPYYDFYGDDNNLGLRRIFLDKCRNDRYCYRVEDGKTYYPGSMVDALHVNSAAQDSIGKHIAQWMKTHTFGEDVDSMFEITVSAGANGTVIKSVYDGIQDSATSVTVTATAISGYVFSEWSNGSTDNPLVVSLVTDTVLQPVFVTSPSATPKSSWSSWSWRNRWLRW